MSCVALLLCVAWTIAVLVLTGTWSVRRHDARRAMTDRPTMTDQEFRAACGAAADLDDIAIQVVREAFGSNPLVKHAHIHPGDSPCDGPCAEAMGFDAVDETADELRLLLRGRGCGHLLGEMGEHHAELLRPQTAEEWAMSLSRWLRADREARCAVGASQLGLRGAGQVLRLRERAGAGHTS